MRTKICLCLIVLFAAAVLTAGAGFAQQPAREKEPQDQQRITVTGRIDYSQKLGGYYIQADNPPARIFIVNPDGKTLDRMRKSRRPAKVEGVLTVGADHLKVEKIDGKPYPPVRQRPDGSAKP